MENKTVLITGSSRGIGKACALFFAARGYNVVVNSFKHPKEGQETANACAKLGAGAIHIQADVSNPKEAENLVTRACKAFGKLDCLVNNAGIGLTEPFNKLTEESLQRILNTNLNSAIYCSKAALKSMTKHGGGNIINIASVYSFTGAAEEVLYTTTKTALIGLTRSLAREYASASIRVNAICPGFIDTEINSHVSEDERKEFSSSLPLGRIGKPEDIAPSVFFLASPDASYITGQSLIIDGGWL